MTLRDLPERSPDRDPALEAALQDHARKMAANGISWSDSGAVEFGWHAAFRSLGCATPEAQAALRELVTAIRTPVATMSSLRLRDKQILFAEGAFAALATPPEEGR